MTIFPGSVKKKATRSVSVQTPIWVLMANHEKDTFRKRTLTCTVRAFHLAPILPILKGLPFGYILQLHLARKRKFNAAFATIRLRERMFLTPSERLKKPDYGIWSWRTSKDLATNFLLLYRRVQFLSFWHVVI